MRYHGRQVPVASACNPSYSGSRDQEDHSSKPAQANSSKDPISKIPNTKKGWWSGLSGKYSACLAMHEGLSSNASTEKKKFLLYSVFKLRSFRTALTCFFAILQIGPYKNKLIKHKDTHIS
jgi:hypothetical protein